jgi:hypothetical protein
MVLSFETFPLFVCAAVSICTHHFHARRLVLYVKDTNCDILISRTRPRVTSVLSRASLVPRTLLLSTFQGMFSSQWDGLCFGPIKYVSIHCLFVEWRKRRKTCTDKYKSLPTNAEFSTIYLCRGKSGGTVPIDLLLLPHTQSHVSWWANILPRFLAQQKRIMCSWSTCSSTQEIYQ